MGIRPVLVNVLNWLARSESTCFHFPHLEFNRWKSVLLLISGPDWKYQICSYSFSIFDRKSIQMKCALRTRMHNYIENDGILFLYNVIVYNIDTDRHKQSNKANCVHNCIYCTWPHVSMLNCDCKYIVIKIASILSQNDCAYSFVYWLYRAVESLKWVTLWW